MPYTQGTKVKFDVTGTVVGNIVAIGCQNVNLADLVAVASTLSKDGTTIRATVEGEADGMGNVSFLSGRRIFTEGQIREVGRNVTVIEPVPAATPWINGDVVWNPSKGVTRIMRDGTWQGHRTASAGGGWHILNTVGVLATRHADDLVREGVWVPLVKNGQRVTEATRSAPRPFAAGDRVRLTRTIGGTHGHAGQIGVLESPSRPSAALAFRPVVDGVPATSGGGYGRGLYTITLTGSLPQAEHI